MTISMADLPISIYSVLLLFLQVRLRILLDRANIYLAKNLYFLSFIEF
jgi:hypothetical protein